MDAASFRQLQRDLPTSVGWRTPAKDLDSFHVVRPPPRSRAPRRAVAGWLARTADAGRIGVGRRGPHERAGLPALRRLLSDPRARRAGARDPPRRCQLPALQRAALAVVPDRAARAELAPQRVSSALAEHR